MSRILKTVLMLVLFSSNALAAGYSWEFAGWYGGGAFPNIAFDPNNKNRVYLTSDVAGLWRSEDLGEHWYFITRGLGNLMVAQVVVAPSDSNVLYTATKGGVFVSRNAGASWQAADKAKGALVFERPTNYRPIVIDAKSPGKLCAGTAKGAVFCSDNYGASWRNIDSSKKFLIHSKPITAMAFDQEGKLYVSGAHGLMRCVWDGSQCDNLNVPFAVTDLFLSQRSKGSLYVAGETQIWMSSDAGKTWQKSQAVTRGKSYRVDLDESGDRPVLWAAWKDNWKGGVIASFDSGQSWGQGNGTLNGDAFNNHTRIWADINTRLTGLFIDPFDRNVMFRTDGWGVWRSDDAGKTWNEKIVGAPNTVATDLNIAADGRILVASMDNGLLATNNNAQSYQMLFPLQYADDQAGHVWRVATAGDTIIATSSPWNKKINQVLLSADRGATFEMVRQGLPAGRPIKNTVWGEGYPRAIAVDPKNPDIIYLGIDGDDGGGLFISRDRGKTWTRSAGQPGSLRIYRALKVDPTNSKRIIWGATGTNGGVYISEDAGETFFYALKIMTWVFDLDVASDGTIYAAGDSGGAKLYKSSNQGIGWQLSGDFGTGRALAAVAVDPNNPQRVVLATTSWSNAAPCTIHLSNDAGKTWTDITGDLPDGAGASSMTFDPESNYLYITRYAGSVYRLKIQ